MHRTLTTLDDNPSLISNTLGAITNALSSVTNSLGQMVNLTVNSLVSAAGQTGGQRVCFSLSTFMSNVSSLSTARNVFPEVLTWMPQVPWGAYCAI